MTLSTGVLSIDSASRAPVTLSAHGARRLTDDIRHHLGSALHKLRQAREGEAHLALGYDSWWAYCEAEFGDLRELRLPADERKALAASMHGDGLTYRQIRDKLDVSLGTIRNDIGAPPPLRVVEHNPFDGMTRMQETLARVAAQGTRGLTSIELDHETGWPLGTASASLSKLERRGKVRRTTSFRLNRAAYVLA